MLEKRLRQASVARVRRIQNDSDGQHQTNLYDLLALYKSGISTLHPKEARRRAVIVRRTLATEACRSLFSNIRHQIKPEERSGIQHVNVPSTTLLDGSSVYRFLQTPQENAIVWEKVVDREAIEAQILRYNQESFRAAAESPCGHGIIHDELSFTGLSPAATSLLSGHIPPHWEATSQTLHAFLASFCIPAQVQSAPPISTELTEDDVSKGFRMWKETTSTSPSG